MFWFRMIVLMRFSFRGLCFLVPPPLPVPLLALALLCRLVAVVDILLGMVNLDLLFLHQQLDMRDIRVTWPSLLTIQEETCYMLWIMMPLGLEGNVGEHC
jgi:hypothetical protein